MRKGLLAACLMACWVPRLCTRSETEGALPGWPRPGLEPYGCCTCTL